MLSFTDRILAVASTLEEAHIPYAFGGAIAFVYYAEPRATRDIDVNVFLKEQQAGLVVAALRSLTIQFDAEEVKRRIDHEGQVRVLWDDVPLDLFFSNLPFHDSCQERIRRVPFRGREIPILSAEDLAVCKVAYNREKDWLDLREMVAFQGDALDIAYIRWWLAAMLGAESNEAQRFEALCL